MFLFRETRELSRLSIPSLHTIRTPSVSINGLNVQSAISDPVPRSEAGMTEYPRDAIPIAVVHPGNYNYELHVLVLHECSFRRDAAYYYRYRITFSSETQRDLLNLIKTV